MKINFQQTQKSKTWIDFLQAHKTVILDSAIFKNLKRACLKKIITKKCAPEVVFFNEIQYSFLQVLEMFTSSKKKLKKYDFLFAN